MVDLFLDPRLPDYVVEHNWNRVAAEDSARDAVMSDFLSERICVLWGADLSRLDFAFLSGVTLPQTWEMKKFQFNALIADVDAGLESGLVTLIRDQIFHGDLGLFDYFVGQLRAIRELATGMIRRLFDQYETDVLTFVTRFSETRMENLHYDLDPDSDNHEAFRFYINLDNVPRLWATSYQSTQLLNLGGSRIVAGLDETMPAELILKRVLTRAFGGWNQRAIERIAPRHIMFFDQGDVWIVDGRSVSHQVVTGHRVLSVYAKLSHAKNPLLRPTFAEKLKSHLSTARAVPLGSETALVNYYEPKDITPATNLKEGWEEAFGNTRTGKVRRFDTFGLVGGSA